MTLPGRSSSTSASVPNSPFSGSTWISVSLSPPCWWTAKAVAQLASVRPGVDSWLRHRSFHLPEPQSSSLLNGANSK